MINKITTPPTNNEVIAKVNELVDNMQTTGNLVTSISSSSTDTQYPSAKCVYDIIGDIETTINTIRGV